MSNISLFLNNSTKDLGTCCALFVDMWKFRLQFTNGSHNNMFYDRLVFASGSGRVDPLFIIAYVILVYKL